MAAGGLHGELVLLGVDGSAARADCLANSRQCFPAFAQAERWNIHVLQHRHADLAMRFATRGAPVRRMAGFEPDADGPCRSCGTSASPCGVPRTRRSTAETTSSCSAGSRRWHGEEMPFVYFRRKFHSLAIGDDRSADSRGLAPVGAAGAGHADLMPVVIELDWAGCNAGVRRSARAC